VGRTRSLKKRRTPVRPKSSGRKRGERADLWFPFTTPEKKKSSGEAVFSAPTRGEQEKKSLPKMGVHERKKNREKTQFPTSSVYPSETVKKTSRRKKAGIFRSKKKFL